MIFDTIYSIIPQSASYSPSLGVVKLQHSIDGSFTPLEPVNEDKQFDSTLNRKLNTAFNIISKAKHRIYAPSKVENIRFEHGSIRTDKYSLLHSDKISHYALSALTKSGLAKKGRNGFYEVDEAASNILMSYLADNMALRRGLMSITNLRLAHEFNATKRINVMPGASSVNLINSILKFEVPQSIEYVPEAKYKEIRESYKDLREPFHNMIRHLNEFYRLNKISSSEELREKIKTISLDFHKEMVKYRKTRFSRGFKAWREVVIGSIATIEGAIIEEPIARIITAGVAILMLITANLRRHEHETDNERVIRLMSGLNNKIINSQEVEKFVYSN